MTEQRRPSLFAVAPGLLSLAIAIPAAAAHAKAAACERPCGGELACETEVTRCLIEQGAPRRAIDRLKPLARAPGAVPGLAHNLARAYLADGNPAWARRTLQRALEGGQELCQTHTWLAWLALREGFIDLAAEALAQPGCPDSAAVGARHALLQAQMARLEDDHAAARAALQRAVEAEQIYAEDLILLERLRAAEDPGFVEPVRARLELAGGATSNAAAGSPTDESRRGPASAVARLDAAGRLVWPFAGALRPALDGLARGHGIAADAANDLSYLELSLRPGAVVGRAPPRLLVWYVPDLLLLNSPQSPWFYTGHRAELELELRVLALFAGGGRRWFEDAGRSRYEIDGGLGTSLRPLPRVQLLAAASARYYLADDVVYDQVGGTALATLQVDLWRGLSARLGVAAALDHYPSSGRAHGLETFGIEGKRLDLVTRLKAALWSPDLAGVRLGLGYELGLRDSTADAPSRSFDYVEHRLLFKVRWDLLWDPTLPAPITPAGHVPLPVRGEGRRGAGLDEGRLQDLLRQEESDLRGLCGCGG